MTRFEEIGVQIQYSSRSKEESDSKFNHSCDICCHRCLGAISCDRCAIDFAHNEVSKRFTTDPKLELKISFALGI